MRFYSINAGLIMLPAALALAGCGSEGLVTAESEEDTVDEAALSTSAQSLVGRYVSDEDTYATELELKADGTFTGKFNPRAVSVTLACVRAPCLASGDGRWNVTASGRLALKVKHVTGTTEPRSLTFKQSLTRGMIPLLSLDRVTRSEGEQIFRGGGTGCAVTRCAAGSHCIERSNGVATCVPDLPPTSSCANRACGAPCSVCNGRPGCFETQEVKVCNSAGKCESGDPTCL